MVTKEKLRQATDIAKLETKQALEDLFEPIPQGVQKQLVKKDNIKALFDRYGVAYEE